MSSSSSSSRSESSSPWVSRHPSVGIFSAKRTLSEESSVDQELDRICQKAFDFFRAANPTRDQIFAAKIARDHLDPLKHASTIGQINRKLEKIEPRSSLINRSAHPSFSSASSSANSASSASSQTSTSSSSFPFSLPSFSSASSSANSSSSASSQTSPSSSSFPFSLPSFSSRSSPSSPNIPLGSDDSYSSAPPSGLPIVSPVTASKMLNASEILELKNFLKNNSPTQKQIEKFEAWIDRIEDPITAGKLRNHLERVRKKNAASDLRDESSGSHASFDAPRPKYSHSYFLSADHATSTSPSLGVSSNPSFFSATSSAFSSPSSNSAAHAKSESPSLGVSSNPSFFSATSSAFSSPSSNSAAHAKSESPSLGVSSSPSFFSATSSAFSSPSSTSAAHATSVSPSLGVSSSPSFFSATSSAFSSPSSNSAAHATSASQSIGISPSSSPYRNKTVPLFQAPTSLYHSSLRDMQNSLRSYEYPSQSFYEDTEITSKIFYLIGLVKPTQQQIQQMRELLSKVEDNEQLKRLLKKRLEEIDRQNLPSASPRSIAAPAHSHSSIPSPFTSSSLSCNSTSSSSSGVSAAAALAPTTFSSRIPSEFTAEIESFISQLTSPTKEQIIRMQYLLSQLGPENELKHKLESHLIIFGVIPLAPSKKIPFFPSTPAFAALNESHPTPMHPQSASGSLTSSQSRTIASSSLPLSSTTIAQSLTSIPASSFSVVSARLSSSSPSSSAIVSPSSSTIPFSSSQSRTIAVSSPSHSSTPIAQPLTSIPASSSSVVSARSSSSSSSSSAIVSPSSSTIPLYVSLGAAPSNHGYVAEKILVRQIALQLIRQPPFLDLKLDIIQECLFARLIKYIEFYRYDVEDDFFSNVLNILAFESTRVPKSRFYYNLVTYLDLCGFNVKEEFDSINIEQRCSDTFVALAKKLAIILIDHTFPHKSPAEQTERQILSDQANKQFLTFMQDYQIKKIKTEFSKLKDIFNMRFYPNSLKYKIVETFFQLCGYDITLDRSNSTIER